ncbi:hypothetical protein PRVXH_001897 [Proteinivorax hydrogeniformans]|uniref:Uncharacterized protein n=1 Tax=Proteinivorax hydrogeniformans TaxID=1826727 RepID=A0AAU8HS71_9FIRM
MERVVTVFKKVDWDEVDVLQMLKAIVEEAKRDNPDVKDMSLGDIGFKRIGNHVQVSLKFVDSKKVAKEDLKV